MAVVGARARQKLSLASLQPIEPATRNYGARAGRMSRGKRVSACWERTRLRPP